MTAPTRGAAKFWDLTEPLLAEAGIERRTMMGLPCVRVHGAFFASCDRRTGDLLVKLPGARVDALVAAGRANSFAPWAAIPPDRTAPGDGCSTKRSPS
jgi:hypothetical protein